MDLSIIIVNWNTRALLKDCLQSVYANMPEIAFEIIVVDNASDDDSVAMVRQYFPDVKLIRNQKNRGFAAANNQAFYKASGKYLLLLNSDTIVHGHVLQRSVGFLEHKPNVGAMGCRVLNADGSLQHSTSQFPSFLNLCLQTLGLDRFETVSFFCRYRMLDWDRKTARSVETLSGCYIMVRRVCMETVGLLDEDFFFFGEETDWCMRMRRAGWQLMFAPVGEITHFGGGSSASLNHRRDLMLTEATVRLHRKHNGVVAAACVYLLLLAFNASRAVFWRFKLLQAKQGKANARWRHFQCVTRDYLSAWPKLGRELP